MSMSAMAILQQLYFRGYTARRMLSRERRMAVLAMVFLSLPSHPCAAGPIHKRQLQTFMFCVPPKLSFPSVFPRFVPFPPSPTARFHLDGYDLTHIIAPVEFRTHNPEAVITTAAILQIQRWDPPPPPPPCWLVPWRNPSI
jgi:hypothetical protein